MTQPKRFEFESTDGLAIACVKWEGHHNVRGVVQIAHGLGEHIGRYAELAEKLVDANFVVYGNDHRGHGLTAKPSGSFGEFGPGGFDQLVEDMVSLRVIAKDEHRGKPYILLGHSMGSFAAQQFVLDHGHSIDGLVLSGSGTLDGLARLAESLPAGEGLMKLMNAAFEPARTHLIGLAVTTQKSMLLSTIRCASRRLSQNRCSRSSTPSRDWLIRARFARCRTTFPYTFSQEATIQ